MFKYLLLKCINPLSDVDLVERALYDLSYKYFLGINPEDNVIDSSSLSKFRKLRLKDMELLDKLIEETVKIAIDKGIIESRTIIIDATHTKAIDNGKEQWKIQKKNCTNQRMRMQKLDIKQKTAPSLDTKLILE